MDYLADDYEIGRRIAEQGMKVDLSDVVVETYLPPYTLRQFVDHQLRWGRTVRDSRRWGYLGLVFTFGIPWALLALVLSLFLNREVPAAWALLVAVTGLRGAVAVLAGWSVLRDRMAMRLCRCFRSATRSHCWFGLRVFSVTRWSGEAIRSF